MGKLKIVGRNPHPEQRTSRWYANPLSSTFEIAIYVIAGEGSQVDRALKNSQEILPAENVWRERHCKMTAPPGCAAFDQAAIADTDAAFSGS